VLYRFPDRIENAGGGMGALHWRPGEQPFESGGAPEPNSALNEIVVLPTALSAEQCKETVALGEACKSMIATVDRGHAVTYRTSTIAWIEPQPPAHWLYHRMAGLFLEANRRYRFDLVGMADALQYTMYGPEGLFDWHTDLGFGASSARKLSVSVLLNDETEYEGGRLEFLNLSRRDEALRAGTAIFFPAYMVHRVSAITRGTRRSLVAWGYGPPFR